MPEDYYQNILYPLQDKILKLLAQLPVDFYLTGGTALSRAYLNHRYSDDLDFFLNQSDKFKSQVETIIRMLDLSDMNFELLQSDKDFVRLLIKEEGAIKVDFINDVDYRAELPINTNIYRFTDTPVNILSNKISALGRLESKDTVDIVFIALHYSFTWHEIISDASKKDLWVNPVEAAKILDEFQVERLNEINWIGDMPDEEWFKEKLEILIRDLLQGRSNSLLTIR